jgi:hypothetical protein
MYKAFFEVSHCDDCVPVNSFLGFSPYSPGTLRAILLSRTSRKMIIDIEEDYPPGEVGQFAICYVLKSESMWSVGSVPNRSMAEQLSRQALSPDDVHKVLMDGRPSAVAWIARCNGEDDWVRIKPTRGAETYMKAYYE